MKPAAKVGLVLAGYAAAVLIALLAVRLYIGVTSGPGRDASSGMFAFGDMLAFLATFAVAAVPATGAAFYFLRSHPGFWPPLAIIALLFAITSLIAIVVHFSSSLPSPGSPAPGWSALATLRVLLAPLFAIAFFIAGLFAPVRRARLALLTATVMEFAAFAMLVFSWFAQSTQG